MRVSVVSRVLHLPALVGALLLAAPGLAWPCSPSPGYVVPSGFELVQSTPVIAIGRAESETAETTDTPSTVNFVIEKTIKGDTPARTAFWGRIGQAAPSNPSAVGQAHPESFEGGCIRTTFKRGGRYLLFLRPDDAGGYTVAGAAFAPVAEDYYGETSPWMKTIRAYLTIQAAGPPSTWMAAMDKRARALLAAPRSKTRDAEALDAIHYLVNVSPDKPTGFLVETYETLRTGGVPRYAYAPGPKPDERPDPAKIFARLGKGPLEGEFLSLYRQAVLDALVQGDHADAAPLFETILARPDADLPSVLAAVRFLADHQQYPRAYGLIETRLMQALARAAADDEISAILMTIVMVQSGRDGETPPWREDAHARETWPRLASDLVRFQERSLGKLEYNPTDAATGPVDYRADPDYARARASDHDDAVLTWAAAELDDPAKRAAWAKDDPSPDDDPALLPAEAAVLAFGETRDALVGRLACQGPARRSVLIRALGLRGDEMDMIWLARLLNTPIAGADKTIMEDDRRDIAQAATLIQARATSRDRGLAPWGSIDTFRAIVAGDAVAVLAPDTFIEPVTPIACPAT
jgi:hypothetical protein